MNQPPEEERFSSNTTIMAQAVADGVQKLYDKGYKTVDPNLIRLAATLMSSFNKHYLIQGFIENSHGECWDKIKQRDEVYFMNNVSSVFQYLPMDKVNMFKDLFEIKDDNGNSVVPQSLKDQIWGLFDAMIKICIKYVHKQRAPYSDFTKDGVINDYNASFFDDVDVPYHSNKWGVILEFPPKC